MKTMLKEQSSAPISTSGQWLVQLISEGVGSSGTYPADVLERDGATAFPSGTHVYMDHLTESEEWDRSGNHSIKDLVGVTMADAEFHTETKALRAPVQWFNGYDKFIQEAKDFIGLSIEAYALSDGNGVVESLIPSPHNAVAVVPRAGRDGKVLSLIESYRETHDTIVSNENRKDEAVKPEDIEKIVTAISEAMKPLFISLAESLKPVAAEVEETEDEGIDVAGIAEALIESGLPKSARAKVIEAVDNGAELAEAIKAETDYMTEIKESIKDTSVVTPDGRVKETSGSEGKSFEVTGW